MALRSPLLMLLPLALALSGCAEEVDASEGDDAIVGGSKEDGFAEVGHLLYGPANATPSRFLCTATLIGPRVAITAAHCLLSSAEKYPDGAEVWFMVGGKSYPAKYGEVHPSNEQGMRVYSDDVAFIVLEKSVPNIAPAKIGRMGDAPKSDTSRDAGTASGAATDAGSTNDCDLKVIGFGQTTEGQKATSITPNKRSVEMCRVAATNAGFVSVKNAEASTCYGDSGGPLIRKGTHTLYGVLSGSKTIGCIKGRVNDYVDLSLQATFLRRIDTALAKY